MRPNSIRQFDRYFLASIALGLFNSVLSASDSLAMLNSDPATAQAGFSLAFVITTSVFVLGMPLLLWFFISRMASNVAKWILVVMTVLGLLMLPLMLPRMMEYKTATLVITGVLTLLQLFAITFLFRADAKAWLESRGKVSPINPNVFD